MRRGFTLIELIITIVIMAGVFAVIPKILSVTGKSNHFSIRQDALLEAVSLTQIASRLAWDENNSDYPDILQTGSSDFTCDPSVKLRPGSYLSTNGRLCKQAYFATAALGPETGESNYQFFNDIDDFNGIDINATIGTTAKYQLKNSVVYLNDAIASENNTTLKLDLSQATPVTTTSSIKKFTSTARYIGKRGKARNIGKFTYYSANIGQISLAYRNW